MQDLHIDPRKSCLSCRWFEENTERCLLSNPMVRPPARVIAYGCPSWDNKKLKEREPGEDDDIPF